MLFKRLRERLSKSFAKNSLYQYIVGSYVLIILIMVIPTIYSMAIWQYNRASYDKIIKNVGKANTILKVGSEDIPEELWNIVCGRKNVRQGNQSNLLVILETGLKEMMAGTNDEKVNKNLQLAYRTYQTLNRNIDLFERQIEQNAGVDQSEQLLDEIRSISNLFAQIMRDFIVSEIESAEKANNNIQNSSYFYETGIAGYTLVYHSRGFQLVQHEPFTSQRDAIVRETDIKSTTQIVEMSAHRMLVADTDKGEDLKRQVADLKKLLYAYRHGILKERRR